MTIENEKMAQCAHHANKSWQAYWPFDYEVLHGSTFLRQSPTAKHKMIYFFIRFNHNTENYRLSSMNLKIEGIETKF
jgi:hypothetical protein